MELRGAELVVRAIICSDMTLDDELASGAGVEAYVSEIWPSLMTSPFPDTAFFDESGSALTVKTVLDMIRSGLICDRGDTLANFAWEPRGTHVEAGWQGAAGRISGPVG